MRDLRSVLQVSVRLSEGGAAGVARNLSRELEARGVLSPIAYGYSVGGRRSPMEEAYTTVRITPAAVAAANRLAFPVLGDETPLKGHRSWSGFREAVRRADVVHFHAVHSHVGRVADLAAVVRDLKRPLVWTMHDQWHFTGRCAQP